MVNKISEQTKSEAIKVAKGIQKPGQTKEQTRLISQGIEKGITLYKQQQKAKTREIDKLKKQLLVSKQEQQKVSAKNQSALNTQNTANNAKKVAEKKERHLFMTYLPWGLLTISWAGFISFVMVF